MYLKAVKQSFKVQSISECDSCYFTSQHCMYQCHITKKIPCLIEPFVFLHCFLDFETKKINFPRGANLIATKKTKF